MDYIIIGGGVYGTAVAWEIARRGGEVLLVEAHEIACGASGGLGKRGVRANGRDLRELPLMRLAYERWPTLHEEIDGPTGYERMGHLLFMEREQDLSAAPSLAWMQSQQGISTEFLEGGVVREMEPFVSEQVQAALYCPKDGIADHTATTRSFAKAAMGAGAQIRENTAITALEHAGDQVQAVITNTGERIPVYKELILLANSAVHPLLQNTFDLTFPIWHWLPQVMLTEPVEPMPLRHLIGHASRVLAMKPHSESQESQAQIMISGGWRGQWNEVVGKGETLPDQVAGNLAQAVTVYPCLEGTQISEADASRLETFSVDGIPIIDKVAGIENLFYGTGWSGHGWAIAPAVARLLADWAWNGARPELLRPFAYGRFA